MSAKKKAAATKAAPSAPKTTEQPAPQPEPVATQPSNGKAPTNGKPAKKAAGKGVIASIEEYIRGATEEKAITKEQMLDRLCKRFPQRERLSMERTINVQVPGRMSKERDMNIVKDDKGGFYLK